MVMVIGMYVDMYQYSRGYVHESTGAYNEQKGGWIPKAQSSGGECWEWNSGSLEEQYALVPLSQLSSLFSRLKQCLLD